MIEIYAYLALGVVPLVLCIRLFINRQKTRAGGAGEIHPALRFFDAVVADYKHTSLTPTVVSQTKIEIAMAAFEIARKDIEAVTKNLASRDPPLIELREAFEVTHAFQRLSGTLANYGLPPVFKKKD